MQDPPDPQNPAEPGNPPSNQSPAPDSSALAARTPDSVSPQSSCLKCGYQLAGLPASGVCPECKSAYGPLAPDATRVPPGFLCYKCGYGLVGLPADGECPECSTPYALSLAFRGKPHPGQFSLAARIAWPTIVGIIAFFGLLISANVRGPLQSVATLCGLCLGGCVLINVINLPIVSGSFSSKYVPPHRRRRWSANMFFLGPWVGTAWVVSTIVALITIALPVLAFGACVLGGGFR